MVGEGVPERVEAVLRHLALASGNGNRRRYADPANHPQHVEIDQIVADCREAGIETMTPQELDALKSRWGEAQPLGGDKGD